MASARDLEWGHAILRTGFPSSIKAFANVFRAIRNIYSYSKKRLESLLLWFSLHPPGHQATKPPRAPRLCYGLNRAIFSTPPSICNANAVQATALFVQRYYMLHFFRLALVGEATS